MITAREEFWDFERASYDDELDAWRELTAAPVATDQPVIRLSRRPTRRTGVRPARQNDSTRIDRFGRRSQPSTLRPSAGNAARSIVRCAATRRRFVGPSATMTQIDTVGGGSRGWIQPRSEAMRIA